MNHERVREIAEAAFKARFSDIDVVSINVKPGFDHYDDPVVDVKIIYGGDVEQLIAPDMDEGVHGDLLKGMVGRSR